MFTTVTSSWTFTHWELLKENMAEGIDVNRFLHFKIRLCRPTLVKSPKVFVQIKPSCPCKYRQIYLMVFSLKKCRRCPNHTPQSLFQLMLHWTTVTFSLKLPFSCEPPALVHRTPSFSFISLLWGFALFCFNLYFPLFFHQSVQPHGGLCILDLMETEGEISEQAVTGVTEASDV